MLGALAAFSATTFARARLIAIVGGRRRPFAALSTAAAATTAPAAAPAGLPFGVGLGTTGTSFITFALIAAVGADDFGLVVAGSDLDDVALAVARMAFG